MALEKTKQQLTIAVHGSVGEDLVYGNAAGLDILQINHDQRKELASLREMIENEKRINESRFRDNQVRFRGYDAYMSQNESRFRDNQVRFRGYDAYMSQNSVYVQDLKKVCQGYLDIRGRFLDVFKRDVLDDRSERMFRGIARGNARAHKGDAVTDAEIFMSGSRTDSELMVTIYGVSASNVLELCKTRSD
jgi:hypothetical protein